MSASHQQCEPCASSAKLGNCCFVVRPLASALRHTVVRNGLTSFLTKHISASSGPDPSDGSVRILPAYQLTSLKYSGTNTIPGGITGSDNTLSMNCLKYVHAAVFARLIQHDELFEREATTTETTCPLACLVPFGSP